MIVTCTLRTMEEQAALYAMHNFGLAFDVVPLDAGKPVWNVSNPVRQRVRMTGKACGLEWAGEWK